MERHSKRFADQVQAILKQYEEGVILDVELVTSVTRHALELTATVEWHREYDETMAEYYPNRRIECGVCGMVMISGDEPAVEIKACSACQMDMEGQ